MIIEIEYYMGDVMLVGKARGSAVLRRQLADIERRYDRVTDNFTALLCRIHGWELVRTDCVPDYVYDRDTGKLRKLHKSTDK